jgi:hypothetical protein
MRGEFDLEEKGRHDCVAQELVSDWVTRWKYLCMFDRDKEGE